MRDGNLVDHLGIRGDRVEGCRSCRFIATVLLRRNLLGQIRHDDETLGALGVLEKADMAASLIRSGISVMSGINLRYRSAGDRPPLLSFHADICDGRMWDDQIGKFARNDRVVTLISAVTDNVDGRRNPWPQAWRARADGSSRSGACRDHGRFHIRRQRHQRRP